MQPLAENTVNVPAFLSKLWKMVNDPATDNLICWSPAGNSFIIQNQAQFWYELLPLYYKHNNMSSFVRQLNMYGFHKMSTYENGTMDADKGEIQFFHPYFQKDLPELLRNIKRKVTTTKSENIPQNVAKSDELARVLADVKFLRGKQANVDSQLNAMKQENAVLWRELAMLRQKHLKQQQIVNKLIQFLVTIVQPNTRMGGLGVKRRYPLMLNESPEKKSKTKDKSESVGDGPTIHELDNAEVLPEEGLAGSPQIQVQSPQTPTTTASVSGKDETSPAVIDDSDPINADIFWDNPELVVIDKETENVLPEDLLNEENLNNAGVNIPPTEKPQDVTTGDNQKVFLNPTTQDTLLSNIINGSYNKAALNGKTVEAKGDEGSASTDKKSMVAVATRDVGMPYAKVNSADDLDLHLESTQSELDQFKDILNGASIVDANALLGLFSDEYPEYGLTYNDNKGQLENSDPFICGSELATYGNSPLDFSELFDDSDLQEVVQTKPNSENLNESVNTPQVVREEPQFPLNRK